MATYVIDGNFRPEGDGYYVTYLKTNDDDAWKLGGVRVELERVLAAEVGPRGELLELEDVCLIRGGVVDSVPKLFKVSVIANTRSSGEVYGPIEGELDGVPVTACPNDSENVVCLQSDEVLRYVLTATHREGGADIVLVTDEILGRPVEAKFNI